MMILHSPSSSPSPQLAFKKEDTTSWYDDLVLFSTVFYIIFLMYNISDDHLVMTTGSGDGKKS